MKETFTMSGRIDGIAHTITWTDGEFEDPSHRIESKIRLGVWVGATPTGPSFPAASRPAFKAIITALSVFDVGVQIEPQEWVNSVVEAAMDYGDDPPGTVY
jgi:hypothetical protein